MQRKCLGRIRHAKRPDVNGPVHVTMRLRPGLPSMRTPRAHQKGMQRPLRSPPVASPLCFVTDVCLLRGLDIEDLPGRRHGFD